MATQYTSFLGLALPVTGELSGSWGDVVNDSITSLLDSAISGTTSLTTDTDVTLTTTNGAANEARQAIILWNPASGTTTRNITAPAQSKIYTVINASGGTQSIVFRGAGPTTGVTIIKGESAVVAWNGSDFIKISNTGGGGSFTNVTISGTTTLSGLTASTALALNSSKEVVSVTNTGTGNNVLATSPTLVTPALGTPSSATLTNATGLPIATGVSGLGTGIATALAVNVGTAGAPVINGGALGTPSSGTVTNLTGTASININGTVGATTASTGAFTTLAASGAVTLSGGTANGVAYLNGSKVLTTGSALTFDGTNLSTTGRVIVSGSAGTTDISLGTLSGGAWLNTPSATAGYLAFVGSSALRWDASNLFGYIGGSEQMLLTSTGLGIGTSSPAFKLDVGGSNGTNIALRSTGTASAVFRAYVNSAEAGTIGFLNGGGTYFEVAGSEQMRLTSTGLGIGTSSPSSKLVVSASGAAGFEVNPDGVGSAPALVAYNRSTSAYIQLTSLALQHVWQNSGTEAMRLDSTGLGIGTSSPAYKLDVLGTSRIYQSGNTAASLMLNANQGTISTGYAFTLAQANSAGNYNFTIAEGATTYLTLTNSISGAGGNLGLGVTPSAWSPSGAGGPILQIQNAAFFGSASTTGVLNNAYYNGGFKYISSDYASWYEQFDGVHAWYTAPSGTAGNAISFSQVMTLDADGDLGIGTTSPTSKLTIGTGTYSAAASGTAGLYATAAGLTVLSDSVFFASRTGGDRMLLDSSGNLGLGVTPSGWSLSGLAAMQVKNGGLYGYDLTEVGVTSNAYYGSSSWRYISSAQATRFVQVSGQHQWFTAPSGTAGNAISFTQAMSLNADGQWLLNTTSPIYSNADAAHIYGRVSGGNQFGLMIGGDAASYTCYAARFLTNNSGAVVGSITFNTSATAYNTSSDYRLKNITGPITTSGAYIDSLNPVEGTWKADGSTFVGLIAHEVQEASRTTVATGVKDGEEMQGMDYSSAEIIANLIAEVKSLRQRLAAAGI